METKPTYSVYCYAPCGLPLTAIAQVEQYLHDTRCDFLSIDAFNLDPHLSVTGAKPLPFKVFLPDLSGGRENKALPCINEHNGQLPPQDELPERPRHQPRPSRPRPRRCDGLSRRL